MTQRAACRPAFRGADAGCIIACMNRRLAVARVLARETLEKRGEPITDDAIEREASIVARGLYVERLEDEIALTVQALIESYATKPRSSNSDAADRSEL